MHYPKDHCWICIGFVQSQSQSFYNRKSILWLSGEFYPTLPSILSLHSKQEHTQKSHSHQTNKRTIILKRRSSCCSGTHMRATRNSGLGSCFLAPLPLKGSSHHVLYFAKCEYNKIDKTETDTQTYGSHLVSIHREHFLKINPSF